MSGHAVDSNAVPLPNAASRLPFGGLLALACAGFITILTEALPAGLLSPMSADLGVSRALVGQLVTIYALGSLVAALPMTEHARLRALSDTAPAGLLQVSADVDPDYLEGSELTYLHGVAVEKTTSAPPDLDVIEVPAGDWAVFRTSGPYPAALQATWAATATDWFPSNPWRLRPGPSIVAVLERADDFSTATCELWLPVERA
jgi:predicted transcriptional regulator YdeE